MHSATVTGIINAVAAEEEVHFFIMYPSCFGHFNHKPGSNEQYLSKTNVSGYRCMYFNKAKKSTRIKKHTLQNQQLIMVILSA